MKKSLFYMLALALGLGLLSFTFNTNVPESVSTADNHLEIPENVQQIIDKSCFGCHNSESKSDKGKKKLQWDKLGDMKSYKLIGKLTDIADIVSNSEMPPEQFLEKKPEATPTAVEKKILVDWAENTAMKLAE